MTLLNKKFATAAILSRNIQIKNKIITVLKIMTRLMFTRKSSDTIGARFNEVNESRDSSTRIMKSMKMVIRMEKD